MLRAEVEAAEQALHEADMEQEDVEAVLSSFCRKVGGAAPAAIGWDHRLNKSKGSSGCSFPAGTYPKDGFGTASSNSFFNLLGGISKQKTHLASPAGFEPALPP
jgi:hypothetical protein